MTGSIYLIGGGEIRNGETYQIDEELRSLTPSGSTFVFFATAAQDSVDYSDIITSVFGDTCTVLLPTKEKGRNYAINAIETASMIYLGGGATHRLMRLFSEWDLVDYLSAAVERGAHIAGMSAGALALSSWYIQEENNVLDIKKGWGIAHVGTLVHAKKDSIERAKSLWTDFHSDNKCPFIAIGEGAAWRINELGEQKIGSGDVWTMNC